MEKVKEREVVYIDKDTVYVKGIGYGKSIGEPDIERFIKTLLKSKYITG